MAVADIDFGVISHVVHFSLVPNPDGTLDAEANHITPDNTAELVTRAHAAGRKVLLCVGGAGSQAGFQGAASAAHRSAFVTNLIHALSVGQYDGLDLDWEPLPVSDFPLYTNLVHDLRAAQAPGQLLTAAVSAYPAWGDPPRSESALFASLQGQFDQINLMTYDLSGAYAGWVSWHNSPLYDGGYRFASTTNLVPSIDGAVRGFTAAGVAPAKIGIGVAFYGYIWTGSVSAPRQTWSAAPIVKQISYADILATYYRPSSYRWDTNAQAAYLSLPASGAGARFISYDDERACQAKVRYARDQRLGGVMIWQLAHGHLPGQPAGQRDPLLRAIQKEMAAPAGGRKDTAVNP